jgi:hypothetical protein
LFEQAISPYLHLLKEDRENLRDIDPEVIKKMLDVTVRKKMLYAKITAKTATPEEKAEYEQLVIDSNRNKGRLIFPLTTDQMQELSKDGADEFELDFDKLKSKITQPPFKYLFSKW